MVLGPTLFGWMFLNTLLHNRYFHIPDGYQIDLERDPPGFARPVDYNNMMSFDIPGGKAIGANMTLRIDTESKTYGHSGDALRFRITWPFD